MIRKILFFTLLTCAILPAYAASDRYCISSDKLTEMHNQMSELPQDLQRAYNELFEILIANNESDTIDNAGCVTQEDLAQICKNVWDADIEPCETFIYAIMTEPAKDNFKPLEYSLVLTKQDFSDIDPDIFHQAFNKTIARRLNSKIPSKLQDMGQVFLEEAQKNQINPFISAAISMYESGRGTSQLARTRNNIAGLGGPGKWITFETVPDSIAKQANVLSGNVAKGRTTLNKLACSGAYCATDTSPWFRDVSSVAKEFYKNYNTLLNKKIENK
ncbi:MAG: glucosaminidase domain-containing protein [Alphaproteobacteria bacterium]|nr:glucosaminidase domain-containing protein [Alphaproteobacteria bacterium]